MRNQSIDPGSSLLFHTLLLTCCSNQKSTRSDFSLARRRASEVASARVLLARALRDYLISVLRGPANSFPGFSTPNADWIIKHCAVCWYRSFSLIESRLADRDSICEVFQTSQASSLTYHCRLPDDGDSFYVTLARTLWRLQRLPGKTVCRPLIIGIAPCSSAILARSGIRDLPRASILDLGVRACMIIWSAAFCRKICGRICRLR